MGARTHSAWRYVLVDAQSEYEFINLNYGYGKYILNTHRCWWGCTKKQTTYMAGGHTVPSRYVAYIRIHNYKNLIIL